MGNDALKHSTTHQISYPIRHGLIEVCMFLYVLCAGRMLRLSVFMYRSSLTLVDSVTETSRGRRYLALQYFVKACGASTDAWWLVPREKLGRV